MRNLAAPVRNLAYTIWRMCEESSRLPICSTIRDQGPDFLIGLAHHPEWATSYTHFADVVEADLAILDAILAAGVVTQNWGSIMASVPKTPVPFNVSLITE